MKIYIASDHAGYNLKKFIVEGLSSFPEYSCIDVGPIELNKDDDYPQTVSVVASSVSREEKSGSMGIVIGASGQGEAIVCNRVRGVRAAVYYGDRDAHIIDADGQTMDIIVASRRHNDANVLSIGAHFVTETEALAAVMRWLRTPFSNNERHIRRIAEIDTSHENY